MLVPSEESCMTVVSSPLPFSLFVAGQRRAYPLLRQIIILMTAQARNAYRRYLVSAEAPVLMQ